MLQCFNEWTINVAQTPKECKCNLNTQSNTSKYSGNKKLNKNHEMYFWQQKLFPKEISDVFLTDVVYSDQHLGALHSKSWSFYTCFLKILMQKRQKIRFLAYFQILVNIKTLV